MCNDQDKRLLATKAIDFLSNHPAVAPDITGNSICDGLSFYLAPCCKRGKSESCKDSITLYEDDPSANRFKDRFEEEYKDDPDEEFKQIYVTYEELYGEPWVFDHVEYWYDLVFYVFCGNPYSKREHYDHKKWERYGFTHGGANTFEDMIIKCADDVKTHLGDFSMYDDTLSSKAEIVCELTEKFMTSVETDDNRYRRCIFNEDYIYANNGMYNLRWLKWFITTDYAKDTWGVDFINTGNEFVMKMDKLMPEKIKKLVELYESEEKQKEAEKAKQKRKENTED